MILRQLSHRAPTSISDRFACRDQASRAEIDPACNPDICALAAKLGCGSPTSSTPATSRRADSLRTSPAPLLSRRPARMALFFLDLGAVCKSHLPRPFL